VSSLEGEVDTVEGAVSTVEGEVSGVVEGAVSGDEEAE
jgi:hypothetical protein